MKKKCFSVTLRFLLTVSVSILAVSPVPAKEKTVNYIENEWNYADEAMEITDGIPEDASGVLGRIRRNGVLRVATEPTHAPYTFLDPEKGEDEQCNGADLALAQLIAERMGVELKILPMDSTQVLPALTEEQCDLSISAIAFTPNRALSYTMSKGYYTPESDPDIGLLIREEDRDRIRGLEDLEAQVLAAQSNSLPETVGVKNVPNYSEFLRTSSAKAVYEAVESKAADVGIVELHTARNYFSKNPDCGLCLVEGLDFVPEEQYQGYRVAAKKGERQLVYFVNGVINEVLEDGSYERWLEEAEKRAGELGLRD